MLGLAEPVAKALDCVGVLFWPFKVVHYPLSSPFPLSRNRRSGGVALLVAARLKERDGKFALLLVRQSRTYIKT